jgi:hypothetical protein
MCIQEMASGIPNTNDIFLCLKAERNPMEICIRKYRDISARNRTLKVNRNKPVINNPNKLNTNNGGSAWRNRKVLG